MSGFVGICGNRVEDANSSVAQAVELTNYSSKTSVHQLYADPHFILGKSFFNFQEQTFRTATTNQLSVWVDGEIYNEEELIETGSQHAASIISTHYQQGSLERLLPKLDGEFIAIIYDVEKKVVIVITDRYGLKPFYFYNKNEKLIMAPELKCFLAFKEFDLQLRKDNINCFVDLGHLMGNDTWFENVNLLEPASLYSYHFTTNTLSEKKYWTWADNTKNFNISIQDAASEMALLLRQAIRSRAKGKAKLGISLSGGLDSRAILASVYKDTPVLTYTFGLQSSADVTIARQVANVAGVENRHFEINVPNWLESRFQSVWKTDGMLNMYHMHYPHIMRDIEKLIDINLSGFSGDLVLGGSYLEKMYKVFFSKKFLNQRMTTDIAKLFFGNYYTKSDLNDPYFDFDSVDPYLIYNRCRRFVIMGIEEPSKLVPQRMPFMANKLMEFSYSLPDEYRYNSTVYNMALQQHEPLLFSTIPSASTGMLVSEKSNLMNQVRGQFSYYMDLVKMKLGKPISFVAYHNWVKEPATAKLIGELLDPKKSLYSQFTDKDFNALYLQAHLKGPKMFTQKILSALTLEIWLQQIYNKRFIDPKPMSFP